MLHETSNFIFVTLGVDTSSEEQRKLVRYRSKLPSSSAEEQDLDRPGFKTQSEDSSGRQSASSGPSRRGKPRQEIKDDVFEAFERKWKVSRSPEKPKRRRRGLLSQTIHEESSSDLS